MMKVEASKEPENTSSQLNISVAEGERKEESHGPALSLQDVFSDSANLEGMQQKTSRRSKVNGRKEAQLQKKGDNRKIQNSTGGRKKLLPNQSRPTKLQIHVTNPEFYK